MKASDFPCQVMVGRGYPYRFCGSPSSVILRRGAGPVRPFCAEHAAHLLDSGWAPAGPDALDELAVAEVMGS